MYACKLLGAIMLCLTATLAQRRYPGHRYTGQRRRPGS